MNYQEFIDAVLDGRSVNAAAKDMSMPQTTLSNYKLGIRLPNFSLARTMALSAGLGERLGEVFHAIADEEQRRKDSKQETGGA